MTIKKIPLDRILVETDSPYLSPEPMRGKRNEPSHVLHTAKYLADFYKKDVTFNVLGPVGDKVEEWTLKGTYISNATFGDLDWANATDPVDITLTLRFDYAILQF